MTEDDKSIEEEMSEGDEKAHFDMYHFFRRKDVVFIAILLLALIIYVLYLMMSGGSGHV